MEIERLVVGQMAVNCYLVWDEAAREVLIVDPGDEGEFIAQKIIELELRPKQIVATHGHFDHIMGVFALQLAFRIPFLVNKRDEFLVKRMRESAKHFLNIDPGPAPKIDGYIAEEDTLQLGKVRLDVVETPGHTPGSVSLIKKTGKMAIVGDLIFANGGVGRTDFSYANQSQLQNSAKKIKKGFLVYPGHGESFTLAQK